jgi:hypothetical protein
MAMCASLVTTSGWEQRFQEEKSIQSRHGGGLEFLKALAVAVVIGETHQGLWPNFVAASDISDKLAFVYMDNWDKHGDLVDKIGRAPLEKLQLPQRFGSVMTIQEFREFMAESKPGKTPDRRVYPTGWSFGVRFTT